MTDTLLNMKAFLSTVQAGSFSEAARQLDLAPSIITKRVGQLEWSLKAKLFKRSTRRLQLTEIGERYVPAIRQIVREYDDIVTGVMRSPSELEGHLRIKAPASSTQIDLGAVLSAFQLEYPRVTLDVVLIDRTVNPAEEGFDIVLTMMPSSFDGVIEEPLHVFERVLCASPKYLARRGAPRHPRDLVNHDCIIFSPIGPTWTFHGRNGVVNVTVRPHLVTNQSQLLFDTVCAGNGIAVIPKRTAADALARGELVSILDDYRVPDLWLKLLVPATRTSLARVQALQARLRAGCDAGGIESSRRAG
jgi:DNA-binding transcriptional LysR family regulator